MNITFFPRPRTTILEKGTLHNLSHNERNHEDEEDFPGEHSERGDENNLNNFSGINSSMNQNDAHETSQEKSFLGMLRGAEQENANQSRINNRLLASSKNGTLSQGELKGAGYLNSSQNYMESTAGSSQRTAFLQSSISSALSSFNNTKKKQEKNPTTSSVVINDRNGLRGLQAGSRNPALSSTNFSPQR